MRTLAARRCRLPRRSNDEGGLVIVWFALMLVLLLGLAAFAVDIAAWHLTQTREQRAADAAALAGAVSFPGDPAHSDATAQSVASSNGYSVGGLTPFDVNGDCPLGAGTLSICAGPGDRPYQYKLRVVQRVKNSFGSILGMDTATVGATATAEYLKPLSMGSPSNQYGNDPDAVSSWPVASNPPPQNYPNFWANVAGGNSIKQNGDAYAAGYCDIPTDGCTGLGSGASLDDKTNGYYYAVDFTNAATVNLEVFDPAFVHVGDHCTGGNLAGAAGLTDVPFYPQGSTNTSDIFKRYLPVTNASDQTDPGYQYCTGDQIFSDHGTTGPPPATIYTVLKAKVPGDPGSAQPICSVKYPGTNGDLKSLLETGYSEPGAPDPLAVYFRQWVRLCPVSGNAGDEYFIQVSTDAGSQGHNRFALRGVTSGGAAAPVNIAGNSYMGMYANVGSNLTQFYLTRVPSAAAGHTLVLNFYDIGDAATGSIGTLTIVPPTDSNVVGTLSGCNWTGASGSGAVGYDFSTQAAPWGPLTPIAGCAISGVNDVHKDWNAQWSTVTIPIPTNYTCNDGDPKGCWLRINYQFTGGVQDTTSWNAFLVGDPVRLVK